MNKLKLVRFLKGISQNELALISSISQSEISKIENDLLPKTPVTKAKMEKIAKSLKISIKEIFLEEK